ncbi:hypothetical protein LUZ63_019212 [Rhynchospora breviuscula]|uniref:Uncharacterized protein n=1 Tax=Rhynchospora breviuscula TaxID=2022672 RepID=A0A9Q0HIS4_9POAL|nr:hypothetical protein LUZ63_019212 [Rhynchospora breviuscula]
MLIREIFSIPAVIPHRNSNSLHLSTSSVLFPSPFFHFNANKLSVKSQSSSHVKPWLNPKDEGEEETEPIKLPFDEEIAREGEEDGESGEILLDFDDLREEANFDRDPEIADILNNCIKDPQKGRSRVEERIKKKRNKILHTKTGTATPMKVTFNKFNFSNSYIWFEFYNAPLPKDISFICDAIRCWHIVGRLGGCNSMNMQLSQGPMEKKTLTYDAVEGANMTPTTFYNIGDFELQDNLARVWVDIGTHEPLLLDVLINALITISSDYVGIKQVVFGGSRFENWKENFNVEEAGCSVHKI